MEVKKMHFAPGSTGLLAPLQLWLDDKQVSEILINKPQEVFIERNGQMERFEVPACDSLHLKRLFTFIANENGQLLNEASPLLSGNLVSGERVQLVIPPAAKHYTLSIRKTSIASRTLEDYKVSSFYTNAKPFLLKDKGKVLLTHEDKELIKLYQQQAWPDFITLAILTKKTMVISGETSSGKTTFLNACCHHIPHHERLITLEDTYEVNLPHANCVNLLAPKKTQATDATITMQDLVQSSLRLRPDRLIMGEIRGREIIDFVSSCTTGHEGSMTSIHASNPHIAFMRMTQLYKLNNVPSMRDEDILTELHAAIDVIIQLKKLPEGRRITWVYFKHASQLAKVA